MAEAGMERGGSAAADGAYGEDGMRSFARRLVRSLVNSLACAAIAVSSVSTEAKAASRNSLPVVRDAEIESLVRGYASPLLKAAGLSPSRIEIVLLNNSSFNAFVSGSRIFVNTGTILQSETPNETIGVLAHEIGHLAGHHQERLREQLDKAKTIAMVASLLGVGVVAAGAASNSGPMARMGGGIMQGGGGVAMRGLLAYQRGEETTADRSALTYLMKTQQSPKGLLDSFAGLARNSMLSGLSRNTYLSSHPAPQDRIAFLEAKAKESPYYDKKDSPELQLRHDLARAKIAAYAGGAGTVRATFGRDLSSLAPSYGDAIATHLNGSPGLALQKMDKLVAANPSNPWFNEMRGEILMEAGRADEAAAAYAKAAKLDKSHSGLILAAVGQALVTGGNAEKMPEAVKQIRKGLEADPNNAVAYRFLAMAYGRMGDEGGAELATAEGYWRSGNMRDAKIFAARAQMKFRPGTPRWRQAQDIITIKQ